MRVQGIVEHVDSHCQFALKQMRLSALNIMYTNLYTSVILTATVYNCTFGYVNSGLLQISNVIHNVINTM